MLATNSKTFRIQKRRNYKNLINIPNYYLKINISFGLKKFLESTRKRRNVAQNYKHTYIFEGLRLVLHNS